jgi:hypothetical protein
VSSSLTLRPSMHLEGVLIEAKDLVNDRSIISASSVENVVYIRIELESPM